MAVSNDGRAPLPYENQRPASNLARGRCPVPGSGSAIPSATVTSVPFHPEGAAAAAERTPGVAVAEVVVKWMVGPVARSGLGSEAVLAG